MKTSKILGILFFMFLFSVSVFPQVTNLTTSESFTTISAAINDADTDDGDIIVISAGTYDENVIVNKKLVLRGANAGKAGTSASRGAESIITGSVRLEADDIIVNGFTINNPGEHYAIYSNDHSNITIKNNIIADIGPSDATSKSSNAGIEIICSSVDISSINILNNNITRVIGGNLTGAIGIAVGWTSGSNTVDGLLIQNNTISDIKSFSGAWSNSYVWPTTRGAYGIEINHSTVNAPSLLNNTIYDLEGLFSHGIGLEANTPNALVKGNIIHDLVDHKSPTDPDAAAIMVEDNASANSITIESNSFYNTWLGVRNATDLAVSAEYNWWGDNDPSDNVASSGNGYINYSPWLKSGTDDNGSEEGFQGDESDVDINHDAIKELVAHVTAGETLNIPQGTYNAITIDKPLTLIGNGAVINNGSPAIIVGASNVNIVGFTFNFDANFYAIRVDAPADNVTITDCDFVNTDGTGALGYGVRNTGNGTVDAKHNFWNSATGPTSGLNPFGTGTRAANDGAGSLLLSPWWADAPHIVEGTINILSDPGNTLTGVSLLPIFTWQDIAIATGYTLEVSTTSTFSNIIATENLAAGVTSHQFGEEEAGFPLSNSTTYYWRVIVLTNTGDITSATSSFKTVTGLTIGVGNPASGTDVYMYDPLYFSWYISQLQGSVRFRLEIEAGATDPFPVAANLDYEIDNIAQVYRTVSGLNGGTKYWWRLIGYLDTNSDNTYDPAVDKAVVYSPSYNFTTKGGAVTAYPSWPAGANTIYTLTPMFGWYTMVYEPPAKYQVIVATNAAVDGNGMLTTGVEYTSALQSGMNLTIPADELDYSSTYFWQVVVDYNGAKNYSAVESFVTYDDASAVVNKPVISYPTGDATIYTDAPTIYWYGNAYGSSIQYSVDANTDGSNTYGIHWGDVTGEQFIEVSDLIAGETYTYVITATNGTQTEVSEPASFTIAGGTSSYPVPTFPTAGEMVYSTTPSLGWYVSGSTLGWEGYYVKWVETSEFTATYSDNWENVPNSNTSVINNIYTTSFETSDLEEGETYKWAVALYDGTNTPVDADYVETSFSVYGGASTITINQSSPADGALNVSTDVSFNWWVSGSISSIESYYVQYSPYGDPNLDPNLATQVSVVSSNMYASLSLAGGTTYKWRVVANLSGGGTVTSGWYEFTTVTTSLAVQPTAASPAYGVTVSSNSAELSWYTKAAPNTTQKYEIEISDSPMFAEIKLSQETSKSSVIVEDLNDGEYYWRVRGKNNEGNSYYSNTASFKIGNSVTDVTTPGDIPSSYELAQNYPNPFNPTTMIQYSMPEAGFVSLKIYNLLGQEVKTLIAKEITAGVHSVRWNGKNNIGQKVTSGIYIYRIEAGNFIDSKKLILLK